MLLSSSFFRVVACITITLLFLASTPYFALAQAPADNSTDSDFCSLPILAPGLFDTENLSADEVLSGGAAFRNDSSQYVAGVQLVVGVYTAGELSHIALTDKDIAMAPGDQLSSTFSLDTRFVAAGEYQYAVAATQGDVTDAIASLLLIAEDQKSSFTKSTPAQPFLQTTLDVDAQSSLSAVVTTKNISNEPLFDIEQLLVLTRGDVPFGTAVLDSKYDSAKLFPGISRSTSLNDAFVGDGTYQVFAAPLVPGTITPVTTQLVQIGDRETVEFATRISAVGLVAEQSSDTHREMSVCTQDLVDGEIVTDVTNSVVLGVTYDDASVFGPQAVDTAAGQVMFEVPMSESSAVATISLLEDLDPATEDIDTVREGQSIEYPIDCDRFPLCEPTIVEQITDFSQTEPATSAYWIYIGIGVGLLVVMFILMRNRDQSDVVSTEESDS